MLAHRTYLACKAGLIPKRVEEVALMLNKMHGIEIASTRDIYSSIFRIMSKNINLANPEIVTSLQIQKTFHTNNLNNDLSNWFRWDTGLLYKELDTEISMLSSYKIPTQENNK